MKRPGTDERATEVDWESEHFTYRSIWHAASVLRQAGEKDETNGFWSLVAATVLAYTAYEGFLNHVIECLYPQVWKQERTFFRVPPFDGTLGKTRFLAEGIGLVLKPSSRPYRTVLELHAWRNDLVHPRTVRAQGTARADAYARKPRRVAVVAFKKLGRRGFVSLAFDDLATLADSLLRAAGQKHDLELRELRKLGGSAFWGPIGLGGASLRE